MSDDFQGNLIEQFFDSDGVRRLRIFQRKDKLFLYIEEFIETYIKEDDDFGELIFWATASNSGLYEDIVSVKRDAVAQISWLKAID